MLAPILTAMRVSLFLARKSIMRGNIGVTILTIFILVLIALNLLFVPALLNGLTTSANDQVITNYSSHIILNPKGKDTQIVHVDDLIRQIESIEGVIAATARNSIVSVMKYKNKQGDEWRVNCTLYGIMPERERRVFEVSKYMVEGSFLEPRDRNQIVLGIQLSGSDDESVEFYARSLRHVHTGDKVTVSFGNGIVKEYKVKGIFRTGFISTDIQAYVSELEFEDIVPSAHETATSVNVKLKEEAVSRDIIEKIKKIREDLDFQTWEQNAGIVNSMTTSFQIINEIINFVNALVAGITIFIVTYVDVVNRRRQIGILRAIGIKGRPIISSYLLRALFYVVIALFASWILFVYAVIPYETDNPFYFPFGPVFFTPDFPLLVRTAIILSVVSLVAAFIPVWLVMRIKIMDAIWG